MTACPRCGYVEGSASKAAFEAFHALRDEYATAQGLNKVDAKDQLCVQFGIAQEYEEPWTPPKYPGVFVRCWGRLFFRKSTLAMTKAEMAHLIESTEEAVHDRTV